MACREDNNESRTIEWLRFVLAVLVVCLHCSKAPGLTITSGASGALRIAVVILGQIPVPIFLWFQDTFSFPVCNSGVGAFGKQRLQNVAVQSFSPMCFGALLL